MLFLVCKMMQFALSRDVIIRAVYCPGKQNVIADFLSHFQATPNFLQAHKLSITHPGDFSHDASVTHTLNSLLAASLSSATKVLYRKSLSQFCDLGCASTVDRYLLSLASMSQVLRFIAALYHQGLSASSIRSKLSAVAFWLNIHGWQNLVDSFVVRKCLLGVANSQPPWVHKKTACHSSSIIVHK